ncbi:VanZ family protein [Anaerobium acetethylicum]|uniref:VanZ family protein n=1 Tax=Anaerobium acetethylicum TaxID=1619234 RepID=UPI001FA7BA8F|nr:VanZ family protein [Anaerobium acetethylicum]
MAAAIYAALLAISWLRKKRSLIQRRKMIFEFFFVVYIIAILDITGIIGMQFNIDWFIHSLSSIGFHTQIDKGTLWMMMLNMALFVPLGILIPMVISNMKWNGIKVFVLGFCFSIAIEFLQMFGGRMSEINDVLMNAFGTLMGYFIFSILIRINELKKEKDV